LCKPELITLYRVAIDEYRFEVKLNTDRMIHYIIFNSAIPTIATGLLKIEAGSLLNLVVILVFAVRLHLALGHAQHWQRARVLRTHDLQENPI